MSPYYKRVPVWPLIVIVACVLVLSVLAPWRWPGGANWQRQLASTTSPAEPISAPSETGPVPLQARPVTVAKQQGPASLREASASGDVASELALLSEHSGSRQEASIAPPVGERIDLDPSIVETPALPVAQQSVSPPAKTPGETSPPSDEPAPTERPAPLLRDRAEMLPPATTWPYPSVLAAALQTLVADEATRPWAERVLALLDRLVTVDALGHIDAGVILEQLQQLEREPQRLAPGLESTRTHALLLRAGYALQRHLSIWQAVHELTTHAAPATAGGNPARLLAVLDEVNHRLADISAAGAWREYLLLGPLNDLARNPRGIDAQQLREVARRVLLRVDTPAMTLKQSEFFEQPPFPQFVKELKYWANEPVDYQKLLRDIEMYERGGVTEDAQRLVQYYQVLRWSTDEHVARLAEVLNRHYRNANVRVAVSIELINRLLPEPQESTEAVVDNIAQADVQGQSWATTRLRVTLLPDRRQWRLGLEANADVASDTESRKGPAAFFHDAWANVRARKTLTVDHRGVRVGRSEANANLERNLKGFETDYDGVPVLNLIARSIAKQQYEDKFHSSQVEAENKLAWRANSKFDEEVQRQIERAEKDLQEKLLKPLQELDLKPTAVDMETTATRLMVRERLAGNMQLGAHTPRPQAPGDSWLSVQFHESAMNNALEHLGLNGRETDLPTLYREITRRFMGRDLPLPEDFPDDVRVHFADSDAIRVRCEGGRIRLTIRVAELSDGKRRHWRNFVVQAYYKPTSNQRDANLERDGQIELAGQRLDIGDQFALRTIFSTILSRNRNLNLINKKLAENPKLADLHVNQFVIEDGWIGLALSPRAVHVTISDDPAQSPADHGTAKHSNAASRK